jgi:hypothetical protein
MDIDVTTADDEIPATTPPPTSPQMQQEQKVPEQEELPQLMNANGDEGWLLDFVDFSLKWIIHKMKLQIPTSRRATSSSRLRSSPSWPNSRTAMVDG